MPRPGMKAEHQRDPHTAEDRQADVEPKPRRDAQDRDGGHECQDRRARPQHDPAGGHLARGGHQHRRQPSREQRIRGQEISRPRHVADREDHQQERVPAENEERLARNAPTNRFNAARAGLAPATATRDQGKKDEERRSQIDGRVARALSPTHRQPRAHLVGEEPLNRGHTVYPNDQHEPERRDPEPQQHGGHMNEPPRPDAAMSSTSSTRR